jgi:hypothetical protein
VDEDIYELHNKLQEAISRAGVAFRSFKSMHHVAYTTLYKFCRKPELARDRTLTSVRLIVDFLNAACAARLLPVPRSRLKEKDVIVARLYEHWWANDKKFVKPKTDEVEQ